MIEARGPDGERLAIDGPYFEHVIPRPVWGAPPDMLSKCRVHPGETCEHGWTCVWLPTFRLPRRVG